MKSSRRDEVNEPFAAEGSPSAVLDLAPARSGRQLRSPRQVEDFIRFVTFCEVNTEYRCSSDVRNRAVRRRGLGRAGVAVAGRGLLH